MQQGIDIASMSKDNEDDLVTVDGVDPSPRRYSEGPYVLVAGKLVDIQIGRAISRISDHEFEGFVEPQLNATRETIEALSCGGVGKPQCEHLGGPREAMLPTETLRGFTRKQERTLHVAPKIVRGNFVHEILDCLGSALTADLVVT